MTTAVGSTTYSKGKALNTRKNGNVPLMAVLAATLLAATLVFEASELAVAVVGAGIFYCIQKLSQQTPATKPKLKKMVDLDTEKLDDQVKAKARFDQARPRPSKVVRDTDSVSTVCRNVTVKPIETPVFRSSGFEAEVGELLTQLCPTPQSEDVVNNLVDVVKKAILPRIPGAEITGFASGNPLQSKAFGVALPEIDIVINASPVVLARCLQARLTRGGMEAVRNDPHKLQKAAVRACTDELVSVTDLKFRRSGFKGEYPKVTLLAPPSLTGVDRSIGIDVSVNAAIPLQSAVLLTECGQLEARAKELIMLVRRWTRDRGVAHAAKGHLSHYGWSLLAIYFLQVHETAQGFLLPCLECFEKSASLLAKRNEEATWKRARNGTSEISTAALFKDFVHFYNTQFDWRNEAASVRRGQRTTPSLALPLHILEGPEITTDAVAPSIEDPFNVKRNVSSCMTACGLVRMREELARAEDLLARSGSLAELLELWVPPEHVANGVDNHDHGPCDADDS